MPHRHRRRFSGPQAPRARSTVVKCRSSVFPERLEVNLPLYSSFVLGVTGAFYSDTAISMNDLLDPLLSVGATQPRGYDQLTNFQGSSTGGLGYSNYIVTSVGYKIEAVPTGTPQTPSTIVGMYFSDGNALYNTVTDLIELGKSNMTNFGLRYRTFAGCQANFAGNAMQKLKLTGRIDVMRALSNLYQAINPQSYITATTQNVIFPLYMVLFCATVDGTASVTNTEFTVSLSYRLELSDPVLPGPS